MALKSIRSVSDRGQFTRVTFDTRRATFNKIEVFKDGAASALHTVPIAAATAGLFSIRFIELRPDPTARQTEGTVIEYRVRGELDHDPPVEQPGRLEVNYRSVPPKHVSGPGKTFSSIRIKVIFTAGSAAPDRGWIDVDLDFAYPPEVAFDTYDPERVWEMRIDCPCVPFQLQPTSPDGTPRDVLFLDPRGRLELLREKAPQDGSRYQNVAEAQFLGIYETGQNPASKVRHARGVVFAGTDETGHRKDVFVDSPERTSAEVGFELINPIHLSQGTFIRPDRFLLSKDEPHGFGGAGMTWRVRAFHVDGVFANAPVDWFDVADFYRDWVRTRTTTLFRRAIVRERQAPVDNMSPFTMIENYGLDSASEPSLDARLARWLEIHPVLVPGRTDAFGQPDMPRNGNESLPARLVRLRNLFQPQPPTPSQPQVQVRLEAQIWGFEMGGFYRFIGGLPPICDVVGARGKHALVMAWLVEQRIIPLATTDPLDPVFNRLRFRGHVHLQGGTVVEKIPHPFPGACLQELAGKVDTSDRRFVINVDDPAAYPEASQIWNHPRREADGDEQIVTGGLGPFYQVQGRPICLSAPVIGLYLDQWIQDVRTGERNGLLDHGFRLIEFMKAHQSGFYCYNRSHQHGAGAGYDNVIGHGPWHVQKMAQTLRGVANRGLRVNPSFALTNEFACPEPLVPFFEDYYHHTHSATRVLAGDTRSLELRSTGEATAARIVPVFQYVYSQQITAKMNILHDDPIRHPGYREKRIGARIWPQAMLAEDLDTDEPSKFPDFDEWRQMAVDYCDDNIAEAELGLAPAYPNDAGQEVYRYRRCLQDVINLRARIFRFGMAGVWGERILLSAAWIEEPYEYSEPAIEMARHAAHFQMHFHDYLRGTGSMLGPAQILSGNRAVAAWFIKWRTFDDIHRDLRKAMGGGDDRISRGTDPGGRFARKIVTDKVQHMAWQKKTAEGIRNLYVFANVGNGPATVQFRCTRGLESRATWRRAIYRFLDIPSRMEAGAIGPLASNKVETVTIPPRALAAVEVFP